MPTKVRKGKSACFTFRPEALEALRVLCPNTKGLGLFLSELVLQEVARRAVVLRLLPQLAAAKEDLTA